MENFCFSITGRISTGIIIFTCVFLNACSTFIEEDISGDIVTVIIPQQNASLNSNNVHFKWEELKGADSYNLQLVQPSFNTIQSFILDTNVTGTEFYCILAPGDYEFQIRGENSAYETTYSGPYAFTVDSVSDLTGQLVPLLVPANNYYSNLSDLNLSWQSIYAAESYEVQVRSGADFNSSVTILFTAPAVAGTSASTSGSTFANEGNYSWGVRATNQSSQSAFSSRTIYIDKTAPNDCSIISPANASTAASDTVVFKWSSGVDPGTVHAPLSYILELDTDPGFGSYTEYPAATDTLQLVLAANTYYWRVYGLDEAGNQSIYYSAEYSIVVP